MCLYSKESGPAKLENNGIMDGISNYCLLYTTYKIIYYLLILSNGYSHECINYRK